MKIVYVEWIDANSEDDNGWKKIKKLKCELALCLTAGFLLKETEEAITVGSQYTNYDNTFSGSITIPKVCIKLMRYLD